MNCLDDKAEADLAKEVWTPGEMPVFSRQVLNDARVTDWELYGWFDGQEALSGALNMKIEPAPVRDRNRNRPTWQTPSGRWQLRFVPDWTSDMLTKKHPPYSL